MEEGRTREERGPLLEALEADLPRLLPELEIVDRNVDLSRGPLRGFASRRADFLALDHAGAPVLVLLVDGRGDETVLAAINALAFARQDTEGLVRSFRAPAPGAVVARIALVAESFAPRAIEGLALLPGRELLLFESRRFDSSAGSRLRFVRLVLDPTQSDPSSVESEGFLSALPDSLHATANLLLRRLARVDAAIATEHADDRVVFRCGGEEMCALEAHGGGLHGSIPGLDRSVPIRGMDDADAFLDEVLRDHLQALGEAGRASLGPPRGEDAGAPAREPLLTPEEIAAFRE